jgi:hypothetical protein
MTQTSPQQLLCQILGISPADLLQANRLLRLPADERNPAVIDQAARWCFSRVQAVQSSVGPDVARWMMQTIAQARLAMLQAPPPAAPPSMPPVPAFAPPQQTAQPQLSFPPAAEEPPIVIKKRIPRRRSFFELENLVSLVGVVVILGAGLFFGKLFIDRWWDDLQNIDRRTDGGRRATKDPGPGVTPPPVVAQGGGQATHDPEPVQPAPPPAPAKGNVALARAFMKDALRAAQMGAFDEADLSAEKALRAAPGYEAADAMRLVVAYQRQYTDLATEALKAIDGNSTVLLPRYGECPFIEQDDDSVMFRVKGKNKKFTINELNGMPGVRFRITEKYLDNAANPANDLILGAWHYVMGQTSDGKKDDEGSKVAARHRWQKAVANGDADALEHGTLMMKLLTLDLAD